MRIKRFAVRLSPATGLDEVAVTFLRLSQRGVEAFAARLRDHPGIVGVEPDTG